MKYVLGVSIVLIQNLAKDDERPRKQKYVRFLKNKKENDWYQHLWN